jgi:RimJ/RimL family protein N-acetyltransferase
LTLPVEGKTRRGGNAPLKARVLRARDMDLRPFTMADVTETYRGWLLDEETVRYLDVGLCDRSMPALEDYVRRAIADSNRFFYMIVDRQKELPIGTASLAIEPIHDNATWGYLIGERSYWGTEASIQVQVVLFDFAFDVLGARRFYGGAARENVMSQFNLRRLGFQKEGVFREHVRVGPDSRVTDSIYYGLLAEDWRAIRDKFNHLRCTQIDEART